MRRRAVLVPVRAARSRPTAQREGSGRQNPGTALYLKYLLPMPRVISTPVDLPVAQSAAEAQEQISMLTVMAARGDLDIDALPVLTRSLTLAIDTRLSEIEEIASERERDVV